MRVFDRSLKALHRNKSAGLSQDFQYLRDEVAMRLVDRLRDIKAVKNFNWAVDIGSGTGNIAHALEINHGVGVKNLVQVELARECLARSRDDYECFKVFKVHGDEESLPIMPRSMDLAMSCLSLHWVNDLPGTLKQIRRSLRQDGVFIGAMLGGNTLQELRSALVLAEEERMGGLRPRMSPLTNLRDIGSLMSDAGFNLVTLDVDTLVCPYPDMFTLISHLQGMAENHATFSRSKTPPSKDLFLAAAAIYKELYGEPGDEGLIPATFQVIYMIGWSPHSSQAKPLERGSATVSLKDIEKVNSSGENTNN
jgi:NADH dehydrogenase [ubiquinone] 1 alpha subcomplex assembly factor 5